MSVPPPSFARTDALAGIGFYLCAIAMFAGMDASTKFLLGEIPLIEVMWARFTFHLLVISSVLLVVGGRRGRSLPFRARAPRLQIVRSLCLGLCNLLFAAALLHVPLATTTAINFAGPVITVALAAVWLHERVAWRRWAGVAVGLAGVLLVLRPGSGALHPAAFLAVGSAFVFSVYQILTRKLAGVDSPSTTIFQTGLWMSLATSCVVPLVWVWPATRDWWLFLLVGALGGFSHYLLVLAYGRAPASLVAPMAYAQLAFSILFGVLLFSEIPDMATIGGMAVIVCGGLIVITSETRRGQPNGRIADRGTD